MSFPLSRLALRTSRRIRDAMSLGGVYRVRITIISRS